MNSLLKKLIAIALLINAFGLCARSGHGAHPVMADQDSSSMEIETNIDVQNGYQNGYAVRPCCTYENGTWYVAGRDRTWWDQVYPGSWKRFGLDERSPLTDPSFTDLAEQPAISGFERSIYTSPK